MTYEVYPGNTPTPQTVVVKKGPGWGALALSMIATSALTATAVITTGVAQLPFTPNAKQAVSRLEPQTTGPVVKPVENQIGAPDWQAVADAVRPATVSISVTGKKSGSTGSGVIWDNKGHIITNHHVIDIADGENSITVSLSDGRLYHAKIVGTDPTTDLAVIKLVNPPNNLVAGNFGSSAELKVGQPVMAVGSPLGLDDTVTTGIISALNRPVAVSAAPDENPFALKQEETAAEPIVTNAIQVDASLNPGNSGGPLFNEAGQVIGINSSIASNTGSAGKAGSIGLGFAIPVDLVRNVVTQIVETGKAMHAQLGVSIISGTAVTGADTRYGAEVKEVVPGSGAEAAGLKTGDVITAVNGDPVTSGKSLTGYVRRFVPGDKVKVTYTRDGKSQTVEVVLKARA
ncbi:trypsin [Gleimia coleocanis DSM 15436]|uniref:Trypsin n=1 Tax=Gleimia coleocanis DSM 15436 TaxID=525245 RepID=C0W0S4_9ACTO|nr:trypsin-like peptidase domain-containing protein [Gleimia coleocanis]EEH63648.1 trypsin [Gleimia coleocanis DSM 15436]